MEKTKKRKLENWEKAVLLSAVKSGKARKYTDASVLSALTGITEEDAKKALKEAKEKGYINLPEPKVNQYNIKKDSYSN